MFRLNDAVRRYQAQHQSTAKLRCVAASVATLPPWDKSATTGGCAAVATATSLPQDHAHAYRLIDQLRSEGALLYHHGDTLMIRPATWQQLSVLEAHWKALLLFLQENEQGGHHGTGRSA